MEEWLPVVGYEGYYSVSNMGRIRRDAPGLRQRTTYPGRILRTSIDKNNYRQVTLCVNGKETREKPHQLVAFAFLGPRPEGKQINHKNGHKNDNRVENLEWVTHAENGRHAARMGLLYTWKALQQAKLHPPEVIDIRQLYKTGQFTQRELAQIFHTTQMMVWKITKGLGWKHCL